MAAPTLTIAVLTKNEAHRIEACLASAAFADQVLVVDSGSTDNTLALCRQSGADVFEYPDWQGFAVQRNRLIAHARCDYIFFLDADELITLAFQKELVPISHHAPANLPKGFGVGLDNALKLFLKRKRDELVCI